MARDKCKACGSSDLYHGRMAAQGGVMLGRAKGMSWSMVMIKCAVCVTCGAVEPYVEDTGLAKVREWKAAESHQVPPTTDSGSPINPGTILLFLALTGVFAALIVHMLSIAEKLK
ncbi:MAG: hypothetical protein EPN97_08050 [Alphaproteobacteria bacterium]|nr:MAG: hypothetical protein EPN97_08050 [Alphaproteobacteria bacterium]